MTASLPITDMRKSMGHGETTYLTATVEEI